MGDSEVWRRVLQLAGERLSGMGFCPGTVCLRYKDEGDDPDWVTKHCREDGDGCSECCADWLWSKAGKEVRRDGQT